MKRKLYSYLMSCVKFKCVFGTTVTFLLFTYSLISQTLPQGFSQVMVANGISNPTVAAFSPDGRIFIAEQSGSLRVVKNGVLLSNAFINLNVNSDGERGLIGIAIDPDFINNQHIYLYYTKPDASNNRVSRFTANGDVVLTNSEQVILELDPLSSATNHNGGTMEFGIDGELYIGVGENANTSYSQDLNTYHGKVLRINSDGTIPSGNPYLTGTSQKKRIWSYGLRNPYTLSVQPETGKIFVNDVGGGSWEEINDATSSNKNFGWPSAEGFSNNPSFDNPVYSYPHGDGDGNGCAITGGAFFNPTSTNYPSSYLGKYFFIDFCNGWINTLDLTANPFSRSSFGTSIAGGAVSLITGVDGNLYFLSRNDGALYKFVYTDTSSPTLTQQPISITVSGGQPAQFSLVASGAQPLSYQWKKNGINIPDATSAILTFASVNPSDAGNYRCKVTNPFGTVNSTNVTLSVTENNTSPTAQIISPLLGTSYAGGQVINFSGSANDTEDGNIPSSGLTWSVVFHHDDHIHDSPPIAVGASSGAFVVPNSGETATNVFYRLILVATDSQGAKDSAFVDIVPRLTTLTITTNPLGAGITLDGQPFELPLTIESVEGVLRSIGTSSPQTINNALKLNFDSWNIGGAQTQTVETPVNNTTYIANFSPQLRNPEIVVNFTQGLDYKYYEGNWNSLPNFNNLTPSETGTVGNFSLSPANSSDNFGFVYTGFIEVPTDGIYTFYTKSDEGSKLFIGNKLVVNNDGLHTVQVRSGQIGLKAGKHSIRVSYFEKLESQLLQVGFLGPGISKQLIGNVRLSRSIPSLYIESFDSAIETELNFNKVEDIEFSIFPNPTSKGFEYRTKAGQENTFLSVYDNIGKLVHSEKLSSCCGNISTHEWLKGIYLLKIETGSNSIIKKLEIID